MPDLSTASRPQFTLTGGVRADQRLRNAQLDGQRHELVLRSVMNIPLDSAPFVVWGRHQALPGSPDVVEPG
jgi:hypothetical protein